MRFYQSISAYYQQIFPLNRFQIDFVSEAFPETSELSLLDIGCGTGELSGALSDRFRKVVGIDLDNAMLRKAIEDRGRRQNLDFKQMNMLHIGEGFGTSAFDAIICFGNTLVHLGTPDQISSFVSQCSDLLKPKGKLMIQIINYDRILDESIKSLPTLENDQIQFVRNYRYLEEEHLIDFETILTVKTSNQIIQNRIKLFPVRKSELERILYNHDFSSIQFFGNFRRDPFSQENIPLVIEASK